MRFCISHLIGLAACTAATFLSTALLVSSIAAVVVAVATPEVRNTENFGLIIDYGGGRMTKWLEINLPKLDY